MTAREEGEPSKSEHSMDEHSVSEHATPAAGGAPRRRPALRPRAVGEQITAAAPAAGVATTAAAPGAAVATTARRAQPRRVPVTLVSASAVAALLVGSATYALWTSLDVFSGGLFTTGDLEMEVGEAHWQQVTPGVVFPASGALTTTPTDFFSMPGDVLEIVQPVTTTLHGDNLEAGFSVDFADPAAGNADVEAGRIAVSFHVEDETGVQVAPAAGAADFGSVVAVPGLTGGEAGTTATWDVVVKVDVLGDYVWAPGAVSDALDLWAAGSLTVRLEQVRAGSEPSGAAS